MNTSIAWLLSIGAVLVLGFASGSTTRTRDEDRTPLTFERIARFPPPGLRIPGSFRFTRDGRHLYYLDFEGEGAARVLVREEVESGRREVVGRPPREAAGEERLSREEILRRERQRIQDRGITLYSLAREADVVVFAWGGDLFLARPGAEPLRLTRTEAAEVDPRLSPDGTRVAFVRDGELHVMDLKSREERRLTEGAREGLTHGLAEYIAQEEMDRAEGFWWSPDGASLAYAEVDETGIPRYPIVHPSKSPPEIEWHRYPFAGGPNARVRLGVLPAGGGATRWLGFAAGGGESYLARVAWDSTGALLVQAQSRDQKLLRLLRFDASGGDALPLIEDRSETWINLHDDLRVLGDGRLLWSSESGGFRHLELRDRDGRLLRRLTEGDWAVDRLEGVDERGGIVYFTAAKDGPLEKPVYRVRLDGGATDRAAAWPAPERLTPERGIHQATFSPDGRWFVDVHQSAAAPPRVLLRDATGRIVRTLATGDDEEVKSLGLRPPEPVTLTGPDGTLLHGAIYSPPRAAGRKYPAIVRVYGGPTAQSVADSWDLTVDLRAQILADRGYVVFRLDNRGTPRRGRRFETALHRRLGGVEVEDQAAGARWLARLPYVDGSRIGIYGWSYGGYMAALCILRHPELFRAAVIGAPVADWDGYDTHYTERYMGTPAGNPEGYRSASVLPLAPRLAGAVLILHGMVDENVHFRHTVRLIDALNAAQKEYELMIYPEERHLPRDEADRAHMERRLAAFFDRHLKAELPR
jgi:dipeptidyl-peptidase-4